MNSLKVLIVEDEKYLRAGLAFELEHIGYTVFTAENGQVAWDIINTEKIDFVLSDIRMPVMDGIQLLEKIWEGHKETLPVILMTGHTEVSAQELYDKGAQGVLLKPFQIQDLKENIEKIFKNKTDATK